MRRLAVAIVATACLVALALWFSGALRHHDETTVRLDGFVDTVIIEVDRGRVEVRAGKSTGVTTIDRTRHAFLGAPSPTTERLEAGRLRVVGICPGGLVLACRTDFRVEVPEEASVKILTGSADVVVVGMKAGVQVLSRSGDIRLERLGGDSLDAQSAGGRIDGEDIAATDVDARSEAGPISLALTRDANSVDIQTTTGMVFLTVPGGPYRVEAESLFGVVKVDVPINQGSRQIIAIRAPRGDIQVRSAPPP
ncbi:MAG: DUF4097 family beta strand repeat-containing protein [Acidimicrobiales bacterium]